MVKPGYKLTEVGEIPEDWGISRIGDICTLVNGRGFKPYEWNTQGLPIIRIQNLNGSQEFNYYSGSFDPKILINPDQLLFAWSGSRGTSFGPHVWRGDTALLNYHTWKVVTDDSKINNNFLFYALWYLTRHIEENAHGASALVHTQKGEMEQFFIPLPPLDEQRAIADALSDMDDKITALDAAITKKRDIKQGTMQRLLTGQERLPGFTGEWEVKRFDELFNFLNTANNARSDLSQYGEVEYIHYGDIHTRWDSFLNCQIEELPRIAQEKVQNIPFLNEGDLIMADASEDFAGVGKSVEIHNIGSRKIVAGLHTFLLRGDRNTLADGFKGYLQHIPSIKSALIKIATGISVYGISKTNIRSIVARIPSVPEQQAIAAVLSDMDTEITALEADRDKAITVKQGMMQDLLTGRKRLL